MLKFLADQLVYNLFNIQRGSMLGEALNFFFYDTMKIFLLLVVIVFAVAVIRSFFPPERARKLLGNRREYVGNLMAALLGIVTPFCSCSAVPLFIGFLESGLPLGVTFSFLISSPTVNEVALVMLWGLFGWKIALLYIGVGITLALISGIVIGKLKLEHLVEDYVYRIRMGESEVHVPTWRERLEYARDYTKDIIKRVWLFVLLGIGIGAWIHGYAPIDLVMKYAGPGNPLAVIVAVLIAIPLYSNAAGTIPIVQALVEKGMPMGTALAFMMAIVAISTPEMIILRKVIKPKLMAIFAGIIATGIICIGYLFNFVFANHLLGS
ncbi:permease [Desulfofundulus thermobenzoicus]|uniref:Permease n=1 Tax=Desulfofundulus thermobenzoicus TaxID=29376 RepID=A0A6N7ILP7_9FIRM|nr:permease [Desulfofundulus thermobenzoicus]MQL50871.1 permease [Desulfofundulus thermobenzoicus]HHW42347.1 permease [Desulfotomaculum sp.]